MLYHTFSLVCQEDDLIELKLTGKPCKRSWDDWYINLEEVIFSFRIKRKSSGDGLVTLRVVSPEFKGSVVQHCRRSFLDIKEQGDACFKAHPCLLFDRSPEGLKRLLDRVIIYTQEMLVKAQFDLRWSISLLLVKFFFRKIGR